MSRYSSIVVQRAREHVEAGWSAYRTAFLLEDEFGVRPNLTTVRIWTDPEYAAGFTVRNRERMRESWQRRNPVRPQRVSPARAVQRMEALREAGLSFAAVGKVAGVWWGEHLSEGEVRSRLQGRRSYARAVA